MLLPSVLDDAPLPVAADEFARTMRSCEQAQGVAVALSGGPDSMALLALISEWAAPRHIRVHAMTVDHALRAESAAEAAKVHEWVFTHFPTVTHVVLRRDVAAIPSTRIQEQARHDRYRMMADECRAQGITHLLLAHHQDDQAETFLFRLCKGSGLDGLAAMSGEKEFQDLRLVRPLLGFEKARLVVTCRARHLPFVKDPSNRNDKFARVRLRQVMGVLTREGLSPKRMAVTAERLARARTALEQISDQVWQDALMPAAPDMLVFDLNMLKAQPEDIRVRILMRALSQIGADAGGYGPRLERVEELALDLFTESVAGEGFTRTTLHHCIVEKSAARGTLSVRREKA